MGEKIFNLIWNNHLANLSGLFEGLYKSGSLTDTTLACQGGMLRAHKLVLAACSPYFERVFKEHYNEQPILIIKGVPVEEMECLLDFMYRGSINVAEEHLPSLIKTATDLEIRGLSGDHRNENSMYSRVETRLERQETRHCRPVVDYNRKTQSVSFLSKQNCGTSTMIGGIKMEEIEVEDDPMVMSSHEDNFEELPSSSLSKGQIRHAPPPMFKRHIGRSINRDTDGGGSETIDSDPTVPAIQMINDDSVDQTRDLLLQCNETLEDSESPKNVEIKSELDIKSNKAIINNNLLSKERKVVVKQQNKAQYKPFPCDLCTLAFTRASHLARHRRVHTGERPFACNICPRMFARQDKLKQHLDSHYQWPKRKTIGGLGEIIEHQHLGNGGNRAKRGRPRKVINTRTCQVSEQPTGRGD